MSLQYLTQNSIHDNRITGDFGGQGIDVLDASDVRRVSPLILDFDLQAGSVTGLACASCIVEVFSDSDNEGETYEGQTEAYGAGLFTFSKGSAFAGPHVTTYATDPGGSTTEFSRPSQGGSRALTFQDGNPFARLRLQTKPSGELTDNRISAGYGKLAQLDNETAQHVLKDVTTLGTKGFETTFYEVEAPIDWSILPKSVVPAVADQFIDDLGAHGIAVNYSLHFWDKAGHAAGEELSTPRFKTEEQIQDFLDYVRDTVRQLKGRVSYYTIWTEPDNCGGTPQSGGNIKCIEPADYIALAERVIPVIRFEDPQAKVVLAPVVLFFGRDWLFTVLNSDVVQLFDVIAWHPFYGSAPDVPRERNYYYDYPI